MLYTESDLEKSMDKIETIHFHQVFIGIVFCIIDFVCTMRYFHLALTLACCCIINYLLTNLDYCSMHTLMAIIGIEPAVKAN